MTRSITTVLFTLVILFALNCQAAEVKEAQPSPAAATQAVAKSYPKIVLYSTVWCAPCKEAKQYFTKNKIPFTVKDVEDDDKAMQEMLKKYKVRGVPLIVIGDDKVMLSGFNPQKFENALKEAQGE